MRASLWIALAALALSVGTSRANPLREFIDEERRFQVSMEPRWTQSPSDDGLRLRSANGGVRASLVWFDAANRAAYRPKEREAFTEAIERGVRASQPDVRGLRSSLSRTDGVPTLDLRYTRRSDGGRETVHMRMLLRYRFTVVATAIAAPRSSRSSLRQARRFVESLRPHSTSNP